MFLLEINIEYENKSWQIQFHHFQEKVFERPNFKLIYLKLIEINNNNKTY